MEAITAEQVVLVRSSWRRLQPMAHTAGIRFYEKLFELAPELRAMFVPTTREQSRRLMDMIDTAVNALDRMDQMDAVLKDLGQRHVEYGVAEEDYETFGAALLWALHQGLGEEFTDEVRDAWTTAYNALVQAMHINNSP